MARGMLDRAHLKQRPNKAQAERLQDRPFWFCSQQRAWEGGYFTRHWLWWWCGGGGGGGINGDSDGGGGNGNGFEGGRGGTDGSGADGYGIDGDDLAGQIA